MSKSAVPMVDIVLLGPFFLAINIHFNSPMDEYRFLWFCMVSTCTNYIFNITYAAGFLKDYFSHH